VPYVFNKYYPYRSIAFFLGEGALIFSTMWSVHWIFNGTSDTSVEMVVCFQRALLVTFVFQLCLYLFDLYELRDDLSIAETATKITQSFGVGCIILGLLYYVVQEIVIPTRIFWAGFFIIYVVILIWRFCYYYTLKKRLFIQSILIVGTGRLADDIAHEVEGRYDSPYRIFGFVGSGKPAYNPRGADLYSDLEQLRGKLVPNKVDRIIVALDDRRGITPVELLLHYKLRGITIEQGISFYERLTGRIPVEKVDPSSIIFSDGFSINRAQAFGKRCFDSGLSLLLFILALPVMLISILIIKLESPGSVFYSQERVGRGRQTFKILKFRSMVDDAEKDGEVWAEVNDSRVTRFGKVIRKTRIDELPQLLNVIKGEMSLVGPRPERPVFVQKLKEKIPYYDIRHDVRPGITGWAQVCYPYGSSEEDALRKLEYDLYYMKHMSPALDLLVIFKTIKIVLFAKGGR